MASLAAFHFLRPFALLLLIPALGLWALQRRSGDTIAPWRSVIAPALLRHLAVPAVRSGPFVPGDLLLAGWVVATIILAGPTWRREPSPFADEQPPVMVVLRVAPSMLTPDLKPTRLDRARQKLSDLLTMRQGAPVGLIAYSGSAHLVLPPTSDSAVVLTNAQALAPDVMPEAGDHAAQAIAMAADILAKGGRGGSILLIADTMATDQAKVIEAAHKAGGRPAVTIYAVAPKSRIDTDGGLSSGAKSLAAALVGTTIDQSDLAQLARRLDAADSGTNVDGGGRRWEEAGFWLLPILALIVVSWFRRGWVLLA